MKFICKFLFLIITLLNLGGCMELSSNSEANNKRFPPEDYFSGERLIIAKAIFDNDKNKVADLLNHIDVNSLSSKNDGFTFLMYSVFLDDRFDITKTLLEHNADPNLVSIVYLNGKKDYYLPLTFATERLPIDYLQLLLKFKANPNYAYIDNIGNVSLNAMPAINAAGRSSYILEKWTRKDYINDIKERFDLLLAYGANINSIGPTGSVVENAYLRPEIVVYLMDKGADPKYYGKKILDIYKYKFSTGPSGKPYQKEVIRRLTELGY